MSELYYFVPNPGGQQKAWSSLKDVVFISGANRAGKSTLLCYLAASYLLSHPYEEDYSYYPCTPDWDAIMPYMSDDTVKLRAKRKIKLPTTVWFSTSSMGGHKDVAMRYLPELLDGYIEKEEWSDEQGVWDRVVLTNGSELFLKSKSQGIQAFQRAKIDLMINDEPFPQGLYGEQLARLLDKKGRMLIGATAIASDQMTASAFKESEWLIETFVESKRREKLPKNVEVVAIPLSENPHIDSDFAESMYQLLPELEKRARFDGDMVTLQGECFFNRELLQELQDSCSDPVEGYLTEDMKFAPVDSNSKSFRYRIWEQPDPYSNYAIGIDPSSGGDDPSCIRVWSDEPRKLVAEGRGWIHEDRLPAEIIKLCRYYGTGGEQKRYPNIIANIETNQGRLTLAALQYGNTELGVLPPLPRLYRRPQTKLLAKGMHYPSDVPGWQTSSANRQFLLACCQELMIHAEQNEEVIIPDADGLAQDYYNFIWKDGKAQARKKCHDDRVIADGLAWLVFKQVPWKYIEETEAIDHESVFVAKNNTFGFNIDMALDEYFTQPEVGFDGGTIYG